MTKRFKAIICFSLVLVLLLPTLVACGNKKVPDGYKLVACEGDKFRLYVPKGWTDNSDSGITSAYFSVLDNAFVSVNIAEDTEGKALFDYYSICKFNYSRQLTDYKLISESGSVALGGRAAYQLIFTATYKVTDSDVKDTVDNLVGVKYKYLQMMAEFDGDIYVLTFSAPEEKFDAHYDTVVGAEDDKGNFAGIIPYFQFSSEPYSKDGKKLAEKVEAPEGLKIASTNKRPYRFFVPESWTVDTRAKLSAAYFSETDKSNVSLQAHMSTGVYPNLEEYFENSKTKYENIYGDKFNIVSKTEAKMGGLDAIQFTFTVKSGNNTYKLMQTVCAKGEMYYILTYTSTPELFDSHLADIDMMLVAFALR